MKIFKIEQYYNGRVDATKTFQTDTELLKDLNDRIEEDKRLVLSHKYSYKIYEGVQVIEKWEPLEYTIKAALS